MYGTILIVDGVATNRILLKAKLAPAFYDVVQADRAAGLEDQARVVQPEVIIMATHLPDTDAMVVCKRLKSQEDLKSIPIIVVTPQEDPVLRREALAAGADEVLSQPLNDVILQARIRSLIRCRNSADELRLRDGTSRALGFAEATAGFAVPASVAILNADKVTGARWQCQLKPLMHATLRYHTLDDALSRMNQTQVPDVMVLGLTRANADKGLRLLADLRARTTSRHAGIVAVLDRPDQALAADALDLGANDLMLGGFEPSEMALRVSGQIRRKQTHDRLRATVRDGLRAAVIDPMTGLYNRRYAMPHLARVAARSVETWRSFAVMLADLDHFKQINDRFGHAAGDAVLIEAAQRMKADLRAVDLVARVGGEEFLIVMPDTGLCAAQVAAERLCRAIDETAFALPGSNARAHVTVSIGLTVAADSRGPILDAGDEMGTFGANALLSLADKALYESKGAGRNQVTLINCAA